MVSKAVDRSGRHEPVVRGSTAPPAGAVHVHAEIACLVTDGASFPFDNAMADLPQGRRPKATPLHDTRRRATVQPGCKYSLVQHCHSGIVYVFQVTAYNSDSFVFQVTDYNCFHVYLFYVLRSRCAGVF